MRRCKDGKSSHAKQHEKKVGTGLHFSHAQHTSHSLSLSLALKQLIDKRFVFSLSCGISAAVITRQRYRHVHELVCHRRSCHQSVLVWSLFSASIVGSDRHRLEGGRDRESDCMSVHVSACLCFNVCPWKACARMQMQSVND